MVTEAQEEVKMELIYGIVIGVSIAMFYLVVLRSKIRDIENYLDEFSEAVILDLEDIVGGLDEKE